MCVFVCVSVNTCYVGISNSFSNVCSNFIQSCSAIDQFIGTMDIIIIMKMGAIRMTLCPWRPSYMFC